MKNFLYSFIIPHKNSPRLLERCVKSIPDRSDIQIIVVDDNSEYSKRPVNCGNNVEIIYLDKEKSKGAGRARNIGLQRAKGKWVIFADSDDYYEKGFIESLDKYESLKADVVYFGVDYVDCDTLEHLPKFEKYNGALINASSDKNYYDYIKYKISAPWNKMISLEYINRNNIVFEEVIQGNDIWFTYQVGFFAQSVLLEPSRVYNYTRNRNGITSNKSIERCLAELESTMKMNEFYKFINHREWHINMLAYLLASFKRVNSPVKLLAKYIGSWNYLNEIKYKYVRSLGGK